MSRLQGSENDHLQPARWGCASNHITRQEPMTRSSDDRQQTPFAYKRTVDHLAGRKMETGQKQPLN
jgi:hypothetical protein